MKKILISSDPSYEKLVAEIYYKMKFVALINQEQGEDNLEIEFPGTDVNEALIERKIPLVFFNQAIAEAIKKLLGK